jgi:hypothetical protein
MGIKYTSVDEFLQDYEKYPKSYNMLVEQQSIQDVGPMFKPVINLVWVSTELEDWEIYVQKNALDPAGNQYREQRFSIASKGLFRIRSAADAHFIDTVHEYNKEDKLVTCTVVMRYHDASGGWASITQSKSVSTELRLRNGNTIPDKEAFQKAESGAQNRCIRKAFNIKPHYSTEQLSNPFVAIYFILDESKDQSIKAAKIAAALAPTMLLYGGKRQLGTGATQAQLNAGVEVDAETGEVKG